MSLYNTAYLQLERDDGVTGTFEFHIGLEVTRELTKSFLMGDRGQYIQRIAEADLTPGNIDFEQKRAGFWIDGGGGSRPITIPFKGGMEDRDLDWGTGETGDDTYNKWDASGSGINRTTRAQILEQWLANTRTDSLKPARFHYGEWTDGSLPEWRDGSYVDVDAGAFNQPRPVAVTEATLSDPIERLNIVEGSVTVQHIEPFPTDELPDWIENTIELVEKQLGDMPDS